MSLFCRSLVENEVVSHRKRRGEVEGGACRGIVFCLSVATESLFCFGLSTFQPANIHLAVSDIDIKTNTQLHKHIHPDRIHTPSIIMAPSMDFGRMSTARQSILPAQQKQKQQPQDEDAFMTLVRARDL